MGQLVERGEIMQREGRLTPEAAEIEVPETVRAVIAQRVRRLSESAQEIVHEASVLGQSFNFDDLATMTRHSEEEVDEGLDEAERLGLIRETGTDVYGFDHALTRDALYHELSTRRRRRLHRAAGDAITRLPSGKWERRAAELAWHFLEGDDPVRAIPYALLAGDQAEAVFAHVEAERHYRTALRLAQEAEDECALARAYEKLAAPLHRSGRYDEALAALERAAAVYESRGDFASLLPVMAEIAGVHGNRGVPQEGMTRLVPLLPRLEAMPPSAALVCLYGSLGSLHFMLGQAAAHLAVAERAAQLAETLGDTGVLAMAKEQLGLALLSVRRRDEARAVLEEAMELAEEAGDLATLGLALNNAAYAAEVQGELEKSLGLFERCLQLARRLGIPSQIAFMSYALSRNQFERGDWSQARALAEEAVALGREIGTFWAAPYPLLGLGRILQLLGDPQAEAYLQEALALADASADQQALDIARCFLTELELQRGDPQRAWERLQEAGMTAEWDPADVAVSLSTALILAQTLKELGRTAEARIVVEKVIEQARQAGEMLVLAEALPLQALLYAQVGDRQGAEASLCEGLDLVRAVNYPYAEARALRAAATICAGRGEVEQSQRRLEEALVIFRRLGAARDVEAIERALASGL
jgi:predicted ATPase